MYFLSLNYKIKNWKIKNFIKARILLLEYSEAVLNIFSNSNKMRLS